jgi:hypothetical protein
MWEDSTHNFSLQVCAVLWDVLRKGYVHNDIRSSNICVKTHTPHSSAWNFTIVDWDAVRRTGDKNAVVCVNDGRYPLAGKQSYVLTAAQLILVVFFLSSSFQHVSDFENEVMKGMDWWSHDGDTSEPTNKRQRKNKSPATDNPPITQSNMKTCFHTWVLKRGGIIRQIVENISSATPLTLARLDLRIETHWEFFVNYLLNITK